MKLLSVWAFILVFTSTIYAVNSLSLQFGDLTKSSLDLSKGLIDKVPDVIPSPNTLFQMGKNVIAGYPFDVASRAINTFCKLNFQYKILSNKLIIHLKQVVPHYQLTK